MTTTELPIRDLRDAESLARCCRDWLERDVLALDTEFVRERTYHPIPGLIQVSDGDTCWLVDPLPREELAPLLRILEADAPVKIMHSASQDLELLRLMGCAPPGNLFDTQVAATLAGVGDAPGYAGLVSELLGVDLAKGETRSDWTRRPLSAKQRHYAAQDVAHLVPLYRLLRERLAALGREDWLAEECGRLVADAWRDDPAGGALRRQRNAWRLTPGQQELLAQLWAWREREASRLDRPRRRVLEDGLLYELVHNPPRSHRDLSDIGMPSGWVRRFGDGVLSEVAAVLDRPGTDEPVRFDPPPRTPEEKERLNILQEALRKVQRATGIPAGFLATRHTLNRLATGADEIDSPPGGLLGWRADVVVPELRRALRASRAAGA